MVRQNNQCEGKPKNQSINQLMEKIICCSPIQNSTKSIKSKILTLF